MLIRHLVCAALVLSAPVSLQAQGELSQCRSYAKEHVYPCRVPGNVMRSKRDHLRHARLQQQSQALEERQIRKGYGSRDTLARDVLRLLLDR